MASGRGSGARTAGRAGQSTKVKAGASDRKSQVKTRKPPPEPVDLKAALPFFLGRLAIFAVITIVLWLGVGLAPIFAVFFGMIGGALAGYPLARIQKRVSRAKTTDAAAPALTPKAMKSR